MRSRSFLANEVAALLPDFAPYQVSVRAKGAATPTSSVWSTTVTCRFAFAPGASGFQVSGLPLQASVFGIANVPSALRMVLARAQVTHLSSTFFARASPVAK